MLVVFTCPLCTNKHKKHAKSTSPVTRCISNLINKLLQLNVLPTTAQFISKSLVCAPNYHCINNANFSRYGVAFSALTPLTGWQERHPAHKHWVLVWYCWWSLWSSASLKKSSGRLPSPLAPAKPIMVRHSVTTLHTLFWNNGCKVSVDVSDRCREGHPAKKLFSLTIKVAFYMMECKLRNEAVDDVRRLRLGLMTRLVSRLKFWHRPFSPWTWSHDTF